MARITAEGVTKSYKVRRRQIDAVRGVSFDVTEGELLVLLGPSGCGKTTTLRCLAGLEEPTDGAIVLGDRPVFDRQKGVNVPSNKRNLGMVFQSFALWPHLTAYQNIQFPLKARRVSRQQHSALVSEAARLVDLDESLLQNRPGQLSGGQQQRVALARALVGNPSIVLFDEPLSNLDAKLREQLRTELRTLHRRVGFTGVYVTHDLLEAAVLGDKVAVMHRGEIAQLGAPEAVFDHPTGVDVAELVGYRRLTAAVRGEGAWRSGELELEGALPSTTMAPESLRVYARPVHVTVSLSSAPLDVGMARIGGWTIDELEVTGDHADVLVSKGEESVRLPVEPRSVTGMARGDVIALDIPGSKVRFFEPDGTSWSNSRHAAEPNPADVKSRQPIS
ncbi:ABC transporter ATP-binding protein [Conexibacter sp. CPCC 206217]|uniref:ABC transporter ATP-binding protein n=1 Tax=Conexibacter sp. CPCC 206217 TaxID=3064574 RepID=UPI00271D41D1|nr:ABC transporter ATP-binding protein [Conexibacter sp. CPCC 206217]MDO8213178.1 ABC transporter ATP-binding protein [Conexibacter sp. CPCC 206217]